MQLPILHQPTPPTSLNPRQGRIDGLFEVLYVSPRLINGVCERAGWRLAAAIGFRGQVLPEERMVCVTSISKPRSDNHGQIEKARGGCGPAMESEERVEGDLGWHVLGLSEFRLRLVETGDICLVMFGVVKLPARPLPC